MTVSDLELLEDVIAQRVGRRWRCNPSPDAVMSLSMVGVLNPRFRLIARNWTAYVVLKGKV